MIMKTFIFISLYTLFSIKLKYTYCAPNGKVIPKADQLLHGAWERGQAKAAFKKLLKVEKKLACNFMRLNNREKESLVLKSESKRFILLTDTLEEGKWETKSIKINAFVCVKEIKDHEEDSPDDWTIVTSLRRDIFCRLKMDEEEDDDNSNQKQKIPKAPLPLPNAELKVVVDVCTKYGRFQYFVDYIRRRLRMWKNGLVGLFSSNK